MITTQRCINSRIKTRMTVGGSSHSSIDGFFPSTGLRSPHQRLVAQPFSQPGHRLLGSLQDVGVGHLGQGTGDIYIYSVYECEQRFGSCTCFAFAEARFVRRIQVIGGGVGGGRRPPSSTLVPGPLFVGAVGLAGGRVRPHFADALLRGARVALRAEGDDARRQLVLRRRRRILPLQRLLVHLRRVLHARLQRRRQCE